MWVSTQKYTYLDPRAWENAGTVEGELHTAVTTRHGRWNLAARTSLGGGLSYANPGPGAMTEFRYDVQGYFRGTLEATAKRTIGRSLNLGLRLYAGTAIAKDTVVSQRRIYLAGADPYEELHNPFTRSRGSLFRQDNVQYHLPGGGNLRGYDPATSALSTVAFNTAPGRLPA